MIVFISVRVNFFISVGVKVYLYKFIMVPQFMLRIGQNLC